MLVINVLNRIYTNNYVSNLNYNFGQLVKIPTKKKENAFKYLGILFYFFIINLCVKNRVLVHRILLHYYSKICNLIQN